MVHIYTTSITLSYMHIPRIKAAHTNCLINSLDIYTSKTPIPNSSTLFAHLSTDRKPYYNSSLSLNKSIDLTSISL